MWNRASREHRHRMAGRRMGHAVRLRVSASYSYVMARQDARSGLRRMCILSIVLLWCAAVAAPQAGMLSSAAGWADQRQDGVQPVAILAGDGLADPDPIDRSGDRPSVRARLDSPPPAGTETKFTPINPAWLTGLNLVAPRRCRKRRHISSHCIPECARRRMRTAGRHPPRA
jgi:hypothetical protein